MQRKVDRKWLNCAFLVHCAVCTHLRLDWDCDRAQTLKTKTNTASWYLSLLRIWGSCSGCLVFLAPVPPSLLTAEDGGAGFLPPGCHGQPLSQWAGCPPLAQVSKQQKIFWKIKIFCKTDLPLWRRSPTTCSWWAWACLACWWSAKFQYSSSTFTTADLTPGSSVLRYSSQHRICFGNIFG